MKMKFVILTAIFLLFGVPFAIADVVQKETNGFVYYLYTPTAYDPAKNYPLVVALHWSTGRGTDMIDRWKEPAEKYGFIVACPNSKDGKFWDTNEDKDILRMTEEIKNNYSIDGRNVLVTGFSGGATISYYLGIKYPDVFSAMAPFSGSLKWLLRNNEVNLNNITQPISVFIVHGTADSTIDISESYFAKDELVKHGYTVKFQEIGGLSHEYPNNISWPIAQWFDRKRKLLQ